MLLYFNPNSRKQYLISVATSTTSNPEGAPRQALSCKLMVEPGMEVVEVATEIKYCLRELGLK